jgi:hypothetical protein
LTLTSENKKILEIVFAAIFSTVVLILFYSVLSMNGLVLGNDPAVHLEKAQIFLHTGKISIDNLSWVPPLYQILLATLITFTGTGTSNLEQIILLVKTTAILIDWLLLFSVYLIGAKFFNKKTGAIAAILLLLCFPIYEINAWGGYTTILGLSFMFLLFLYLPLAKKDLGYIMVTFLAGFSLVLSHQLATFLTVLILPPVILFMLIKSRGTYLKALIALILGGGIAFFIYYFQPVMSHIDIFIEHVFLSQKTMVYQIGATTFNAFMVNFGFVIFFAVGGSLLAFFSLRAKKMVIPYLVLILSLVVPFVLAESHLFGLYLPFQWFIYYLMPPLAIFAAVTFTLIIDKLSVFYFKYKTKWKQFRLKAVTFSFIIILSLIFAFRFAIVHGKIMEASVYYSTTDLKAYDAGIWLRNNFPDETTVVVTEIPGFWFRLYSGKTIIAETDPIIERNTVAASVLELAYELEHPLTLVRAYDMTKGDVADENYVSINNVWYKVSDSAADGNKISYRANGVYKEDIPLSIFTRESVFEDQGSPKKVTFSYFNDEINITQTILVQNYTYPIKVVWSLTPTESEITDVALYLSTFFNLQFSFEEAYIPGILDWQNPWENYSNYKGNEWAVVNFSRSTLTDTHLGFYDATEEIVFALNFQELPDWGNVGALESMQIDAVRFQYNFDKVDINEAASFTYQYLAFSKNSFPEMPSLTDLQGLFDFKPATEFEIKSRDYHEYIRDENIGFLVYDKNQLDTKLARCKLLEIVYSNDRYIIFKIKNNS